MNLQSAASTYTRTAIDSAPPIKLVHMMYEGAIRFVEMAERFDPVQEPTQFAQALRRADAIVSELRVSLEYEHAPELANNLNSLYLFVEDRLRDAQLGRTREPLPAARQVLATLLDGWRQVGADDAPAEPNAKP